MKAYAPLNSNLPLGQLIQEAWSLADSAYPSFPFEDYDLFVIFHAGSGKDIDLQSSIGYDPTPYDIPSLYFSFNGLKNIFGSALRRSSTEKSSGVFHYELHCAAGDREQNAAGFDGGRFSVSTRH